MRLPLVVYIKNLLTEKIKFGIHHPSLTSRCKAHRYCPFFSGHHLSSQVAHCSSTPPTRKWHTAPVAMKAFIPNLLQSENVFPLLSHSDEKHTKKPCDQDAIDHIINSALRKCCGGANRSTSWIGVNPGYGVV